VAQANVKLIVDASNAQRALRGVQKQTNQLQQSFGGLRTAIAGIGFTLLAKQTISTTSNFQALQIRMKVLTSEFNEFAGAQELVRKAQDKFNLSIVEATQGITDIFARLRPLGIALKDIETVFFGFNTIAKEAGLTSQEASAAFTQLAQGLGSGRLQGDEFRSIAEQVPQLLKAISDETGIATGKLKDFASKGLLTTDVILRALAKSADEGADKIEKIMAESPAEVFKEFSNAVLELQLTLGSKLLPTVLEVTKVLSKFVDGITGFIDSEGGKVTLAFIGIAAAIKGITVVSTVLMVKIAALKANFLAMSMASAAASGNLSTTATMAFATAGGFTKATAAATAFKLALAKTGIGLAIVGLGFFITKLLEARNAQSEFNTLINEGTSAMINQAIATRKARIDELEKEIRDMNPILKSTLNTLDLFTGASLFGQELGVLKQGKEIKDLQKEIEELEGGLPNAEARELAQEFERVKKSLVDKNKELEKIIERSKIETEEGKKQFDLETRRAELIEKFGEEKAAIILKEEEYNRELEKGVEILKKQEELAKKLDEEFKKIGEAISEGVTDALTDAVMGTKSLAQAARALLNDIARSLIRLGINQFIGGLFNFGSVPNVGNPIPTDTNLSGTFVPSLGGKGFANGGRPPVGQASLVGEKGAELFVPSRAGTIIPNNKLGGVTNNIVVNVNMEGDVDAQGGEEEGRQLGRLIAAAVQSEIIQQKRAGGLLA
jgi:tape measure domain-containing protein